MPSRAPPPLSLDDGPSQIRSGDRRATMVRLEAAVRRGAGAVIVGEAGIGKSHAVRALASRLRTRGATVEFVQATEAASSVPFGAFAGLLESKLGTSADLLEVLRSTGALLARRSLGTGLVVVVDDAHRLDPPSAALLLQLVTRHGVRVLATARSGAPAPDAVTALWKDAGLRREDLAPLSEEAAGDVVADLLGAPAERLTRRWLWETSGGNPLFLIELVRVGADNGALVREREHWRSVGPITPPARLLDLLDERIEALTTAERRALALVALTEPADLDLLDRLDALDAARALEVRQLLAPAEASGRPALRVGHPLYGEAVRASLRAIEARDLRAELSRQLDPASHGARLRLATWALDDGRAGDGELLLEAAREALATFDAELAIRLGRAAMAARPGLDAALLLAAALRATGCFDEAEAQLAMVEDEARPSPLVTRYLFLRATNLAWGLGRSADARALLERVAVEPGRSAVAAALESFDRHLREAVRSARRALANERQDQLAQAIATVVIGRDLASLGDPAGALDAVDHADDQLGEVESEWPRASIAVFASFHLAEQWTERRRALERRHAAARASRDDARAALCELAFARLAIPCGDLRLARRFAEDALARMAFMDPRALASVCHAVIAEVEAICGNVDAADAALRRGFALLEGRPPNPMGRGFLTEVSPVVLAGAGEFSRAQEIALGCAQAAGEAILAEAEALHLHMRVGGEPGRTASRLAEIAAATEAGMVRLWAHQATRARDCDGPGLEAVATRFEEVGARIYAAEAAAQAAVAYPPGDARRRSENRAARLAVACGARGLTLVRSMPLVDLTVREREAAVLVAHGLSNAEIAKRLSLSVRTVESYIYRATTKVGVHDRVALAALLAGHRAPGR